MRFVSVVLDFSLMSVYFGFEVSTRLLLVVQVFAFFSFKFTFDAYWVVHFQDIGFLQSVQGCDYLIYRGWYVVPYLCELT